jgi:predicted SnoaL-like aldol condensation-catalyzing enzyme
VQAKEQVRLAVVAAFAAGAIATGVGVASAGDGTPGHHGPDRCHDPAALERNKANVVGFYTLAFNEGKPAKAVKRYVGATYIQHNPLAADGPQAFIEFVSSFKAANPGLNVDIKRVIAECDLVVTHSHVTTSPEDRGQAAADIFRLDENGRILEHWDVVQPVPETSANDNGMF